MTKLLPEVRTVVEKVKPYPIATASPDGKPNLIYVSFLRVLDDETIQVADNFFDKTRKNLLKGGKGSLLFITNGGKAYQIKGELEYHTEGEIFDDMKSWNPTKHPGHAAAVVKVEQVYSGAEKIC